MNKYINTAILANPWNWISIGVMAAILLVAGFAIYSRVAASGDNINDGTSNVAKEKAE